MKSLQASVQAYEQALTVRTKDALPQAWARTQMNLDVAYMGLGERAERRRRDEKLTGGRPSL